MTSAELILASLASVAALAGASVRPTGRIIAVASVGGVPAGEIERLLPAIREAFDSDAILASAVDVPADAWDGSRRQHRAARILDALASAKSPSWERLLGVADVDLYAPGLNFVFGEADPDRGVALFSLARLRSDDDALFSRRAATEAIHELGHTFGLSHCSDPRCVMWFSNTLAETDRKGMRFCERHAAELARARLR